MRQVKQECTDRLDGVTDTRANCRDNAVTGSFFSSLKKERIRKRIYRARDLTRADVFDCIDGFYNQTCCQSCLGDIPTEARKCLPKQEKASP